MMKSTLFTFNLSVTSSTVKHKSTEDIQTTPKRIVPTEIDITSDFTFPTTLEPPTTEEIDVSTERIGPVTTEKGNIFMLYKPHYFHLMFLVSLVVS